MWKRNEMIISDVFFYVVIAEIVKNDDIEPRSVVEAQRRSNWLKWEEAI